MVYIEESGNLLRRSNEKVERKLHFIWNPESKRVLEELSDEKRMRAGECSEGIESNERRLKARHQVRDTWRDESESK